MKIKEGVIIQGLRYKMREVLITADKIWSDLGQELVVTSALDGVHSAESLHYYGLAVDLRTRYFSKDNALRAWIRLREALPDFDVVDEVSHIHVEYEPFEEQLNLEIV